MAEVLPRSPFDEKAISESIVMVCRIDGTAVGTGFVVSPGAVLTCDHVVSPETAVRVRSRDGIIHVATRQADDRFIESDLALLRCPSLTAPALPAARAAVAPMRFWSKGYQLQSENIRDALPIAGSIEGTTHVVYTGTRRYDQDQALVLSEGQIHGGMSGAPIIDHRWGTVVGVVNSDLPGGTNIRGFGLSLERAASSSPQLADLLAANRREVPSFGPYLNAVVAAEICRKSVRRAIDQLASNGQIVLDRYCTRKSLGRAIDQFLEGDGRILVLVGPSGTGKTMELARIATTPDARSPMLWISAAAIQTSVDAGLPGALDASLGTAAKDLLPEDALAAVTSAFRERGDRLLVLLDGMNEAPESITHGAKIWFGQTIDWLRKTDAKLIATCRPDYWDSIRELLPNDLLHRPEESSQPILLVQDFNEAEMRDAVAKYDLAGVDPHDVRHPLMARIYWEFAKDRSRPAGPLSRYDAVEQLIDLRCGRIGLAIGVPPKSVRRVLSEIARRTLAREEMSLDSRSFDELNRDRSIPDRLIEENLLVRSGTSYRYVFDQVGELLESEHVALEPDATGQLTFGPQALASSAHAGAFLFSILRVEGRQPALLRQVLSAVMSSYVETRDPRTASLLGAVLATLRRRDAFTEAIHELDLPAPQKLSLFRIMAAAEDSYEWERKNWDREELQALDGVRSQTRELIAADPLAAFHELVTWLDDRTQLEGGWTCVGDVARGLLYQSADLAFADLCELLATKGGEDQLLERLAAKHRTEMLTLCEQWATREGRDLFAALCARSILQDPADEGQRDRAVDLLRRIVKLDRARRAQGVALEVLMRRSETRPEVLDEVVARFRDGDPAVPVGVVACGIRSHYDQVFPALSEYLREGPDDQNKAEIAVALAQATGRDEAAAEAVVVELERLWPSPANRFESWFASALEELFFQGPWSPRLTSRITALAERIMREGSPSVRGPMIAVAFDASLQLDPTFRHRLLELLLSSSRDDDDVLRLVGVLDSRTSTSFVDRVLQHPMQDQRRFEEALLRRARGNDGFAEVLSDRLGQSVYRPAFVLAEFLTRIGAGLAAPAAARDIPSA